MILKKIFLIIVLSLLCITNKAQKYTVDSSTAVSQPLTISTGYFSNFLVDPGMNLGIERPFKTIIKSRVTKKGKQKINRHQFYNSVNLGFYHTKNQQTSFFSSIEIGYRKIKKSGFKTELELGVGYMRTLLDGITYEVDENNNITTKKYAGSNYLMPSLGIGFGYYHGLKKPSFPISFVIKPSLFFQYPHNSVFLTHLGMELSVSYQFNKLVSVSKSVYKSKK